MRAAYATGIKNNWIRPVVAIANGLIQKCFLSIQGSSLPSQELQEQLKYEYKIYL